MDQESVMGTPGYSFSKVITELILVYVTIKLKCFETC